MFRHKDRLLKEQRLAKHRNRNKERPKPTCRAPILDELKIKQQILNKKDNIKVHKNDLRHLERCRQETLIRCEHDNIGNTKVNTLVEAYNEIKPCEIPYDCKYKHDMTKWKINKQKTKEKNNRRQYKIDANNISDTQM